MNFCFSTFLHSFFWAVTDAATVEQHDLECDIAFIQQFYKHHLSTDYDLFVYLMIYLAPQTQIDPQLDLDWTVAKQHKHTS